MTVRVLDHRQPDSILLNRMIERQNVNAPTCGLWKAVAGALRAVWVISFTFAVGRAADHRLPTPSDSAVAASLSSNQWSLETALARAIDANADLVSAKL